MNRLFCAVLATFAVLGCSREAERDLPSAVAAPVEIAEPTTVIPEVEAQAEIDAMQPLIDNEAIWLLDGNDYPASQILAIADLLAKGELALAREDYAAAITAYSAAVETQDTLPYTEPPFWYYPTRQSLGHTLLLAGDNTEAELVFGADLSLESSVL